MTTLLVTLALAQPPSGAFRVEWDREGVGYSPRYFTGVVDFDDQTLAFEQTTADFEVDLLNVHDDGTFLLEATVDDDRLRLMGMVDDDELVAMLSYNDWPFLPAHGWSLRQTPLVVDAPSGAAVATPEEVGLDRTSVEAMVQRSQQLHTSGLVVLKDGKVVVHQQARPGRHNIHSISKPVAAMGVALLIEDGLLPSLDTPLGEVIEEWHDDPRGRITLRHVLSHTSGLAYEPDAHKVINRHPDRTKLVLESPLEHPPGTVFGYSNRSMGLVAVAVQRLSGRGLDDYVQQRVLEPLGVEATWPRDRAGSPVAFGGIGLTAFELAQVGQLFLDGGHHDGVQLLPESWVNQAAQPSPYATKVGISWFLGDEGAFGHTGSGGQNLQVYPATGVVFARLHGAHPTRGDQAAHHSGMELMALAQALATEE